MIVNNYLMQQQQAAIQRALTLDNMATPFGCCNFFDRCGDGDLMSLHFAGGLPLLDWMGFNVSDVCNKTFEFITYVRPAQAEGSSTAGYISQPCADPNGVEFGTTKLTLQDFGRYGRRGPTRDIMKPKNFCVTDQRRRLDGQPVTDEREWDMRFATEVIIQDISKDLIVGNNSTAGKFDGLERWVKTGYPNSALDSIVIDWNGNDLGGGAGVTWNGSPIASTFDFVDVLRSAVRRIRQRISWSPVLGSQRMNLGDLVLVMPAHVAECLLDFYTCWSVCTSTQDIAVQLQSFEARRFRDQLLGGLFGYGQITIDGIPIPILAYDWELIKSATLSDVYLLSGSVGSVQMWFGEHLQADEAARAYSTQGYFSTDGGRILAAYVVENECAQLKEWMHPRIYTRAPWANVRFKDVKCTSVMDPLSPDTDSSFFITSSFDAAACSSFG